MDVPRAAALVAVAALVACSDSRSPDRRAEPIPSGGAVLYTIGVSTDPYSENEPSGFGVATRLLGRIEQVERRTAEYGWFGGAEWISDGRILVHRKGPPLRQPIVFRFVRGRLARSEFAPFVSGSAYRWSPDRVRLAVEPPAPCERGQASLFECYRGSRRIVVSGPGERFTLRGTGPAWTRDGRLVFYGTQRDLNRGRATLLDLATGRRKMRKRYWLNEQPLVSPDGRYLADRTGTENGSAIVVTDARGNVVRRLRTPYIVSMLAWSPRGDRLAYTTSGFPDPHELFLVDLPTGQRKRIFASGVPHFDWITWSPDGRWLLLDGDEAGSWRVFSAATGKQVRRLPRLGGKPTWCCPVSPYDALTGRRDYG